MAGASASSSKLLQELTPRSSYVDASRQGSDPSDELTDVENRPRFRGSGPYASVSPGSSPRGSFFNSHLPHVPSLTYRQSVLAYEYDLPEARDPSRLSEMRPMSLPVSIYVYDENDPDLEDDLHDPQKPDERAWTWWSSRGWLRVIPLAMLLGAMLMLFVGYPILTYYRQNVPLQTGFNLGGINGSGQVPVIPGVWQLIDPTTPADAMTRTGFDGEPYQLVFSDEFSVDGRTFYPGDDPYWEAVDFNYWATNDYEWYDPSAITTENGKLVITMTEELIHNKYWKSGMLQSWNKFCFTTGYIEVAVSLPGSPYVPGFWPGVWTMGNLGRPGYGATTDGLWPYSYDTCNPDDVGTFPKQLNKNNEPATALKDGDSSYNGQLSLLPGQRLSACTCPNSDHPGPMLSDGSYRGRGAPELDILEAQVDIYMNQGTVSQSFQVAPFDDFYTFDNSSAELINPPPYTVYNGYKGGVYQQSVSAVTYVNPANYNGSGYGIHGFEYWSNPNNRAEGYVLWVADGKQTWKLNAAALHDDPAVNIGDRIITEEPMSIVLNNGISSNWEGQDFTRLEFPARMYIDYVRVYQRTSVVAAGNSISCDPPNYPTAQYINDHLDAYMNSNLTTWANANYTFPSNKYYDGC